MHKRCHDWGNTRDRDVDEEAVFPCTGFAKSLAFRTLPPNKYKRKGETEGDNIKTNKQNLNTTGNIIYLEPEEDTIILQLDHN